MFGFLFRILFYVVVGMALVFLFAFLFVTDPNYVLCLIISGAIGVLFSVVLMIFTDNKKYDAAYEQKIKEIQERQAEIESIENSIPKGATSTDEVHKLVAEAMKRRAEKDKA